MSQLKSISKRFDQIRFTFDIIWKCITFNSLYFVEVILHYLDI